MNFDQHNPSKFGRFCNSLKQSKDNSGVELNKSSQKGRKLLKIVSIKIDQPHSHTDELNKLKPYQMQSNKSGSQDREGNVSYYRQKSQTLQAYNHNMDTAIRSSSNKENVKRRITSLQKYFAETKSMQVPFRTQNRIHQNNRFIQQIDDFQYKLLKVKKQQQEYALTQRICSKRKRLSQTRPKKLKIHELQNSNVKKQKNNILIEKIIRQKVHMYQQNQYKNYIHCIDKNKDFQRLGRSKLDHQLKNLEESAEKIYYEIRHLKKQAFMNKERKATITEYLKSRIEID